MQTLSPVKAAEREIFMDVLRSLTGTIGPFYYTFWVSASLSYKLSSAPSGYIILTTNPWNGYGEVLRIKNGSRLKERKQHQHKKLSEKI